MQISALPYTFTSCVYDMSGFYTSSSGGVVFPAFAPLLRKESCFPHLPHSFGRSLVFRLCPTPSGGVVFSAFAPLLRKKSCFPPLPYSFGRSLVFRLCPTPSEGVLFSAFALLLRKEYGARPLAKDTQRTDFAVNFLCTPSEGVPHSREIPTPFEGVRNAHLRHGHPRGHSETVIPSASYHSGIDSRDSVPLRSV